MKKILATIGVLGALVSTNASAVLMSEVADNAYISVGGYDIAWANPCAANSPSCGVIDLSYQSQFGWGLMSEGLFNQLGISAQSFVFDGANVDYASGNNLDEASGANVHHGGLVGLQGDVAVAAPWFSNVHLHIDYNDGFNGLWSFADNNGGALNEALVVRVSRAPEPSVLALLALGVIGVGFARKKKAA
jgi:hypothetical protein